MERSTFFRVPGRSRGSLNVLQLYTSLGTTSPDTLTAIVKFDHVCIFLAAFFCGDRE